ncbi:antibiotic biosynthesis monooxygenase family protein [Lysobacter solisilvae (ex Woo and Kim 2020)]|uniref:Antibiotic biosynthesis monooxygenase n=1 Tax=Agrilutibacter terrestris TaxID=2865112 RepID=A0A7H0FUN7_9GAMM|nr:antibiotic biosynthesis monooxygenase family protein [Lysobacter terrestris]QNP39753.1 antibiotic biosynthesis monooxygenase [Lysobacter terrestris]
MFAVIWEYEVRAGAEAEFAALYGRDGAWVALFRRHDGYVDTELWRDADTPDRFVTIDRWTSATAYAAFITTAQPDYAQIDARGDALTLTERCLGRYTAA